LEGRTRRVKGAARAAVDHSMIVGLIAWRLEKKRGV
jgi:hypothetical protein